MKYLNRFAMVVGYFVLALWLAGTLGVGDFSLSYGPSNSDPAMHYTCVRGNSFFTKQKYTCSFHEWAKQQAAKEIEQ